MLKTFTGPKNFSLSKGISEKKILTPNFQAIPYHSSLIIFFFIYLNECLNAVTTRVLHQGRAVVICSILLQPVVPRTEDKKTPPLLLCLAHT